MSIAISKTGCTLAAIALTFVVGIRGAVTGPKFFDDDPITVEPETQDASKVSPRKIDLLYDLPLNQFAKPGLPIGSRAQNVNTIDEVPDSSWFTNRIVARPMSTDEMVRGPAEGKGPAAGTWTVIRAKSEGAAPGFTIRDSAGVTWFIAFDPKSIRKEQQALPSSRARSFGHWAIIKRNTTSPGCGRNNS